VKESDLEPALQLLREDEEFFNGRPSRLQLSDLRQWLGRVADLEHDAWYDGDSVAWFERIDDLGFAVGVVRPRAKGRGIGSLLVDRNEARLRELGVSRVHSPAFAADSAAAALLQRHGYREVRRFYEMAIELTEPPAAPAAVVETLDVFEARAFHAALDEAFQDHWEHHSLPFETWWEEKQNASGFDPSLWFLIRDGEDVAAVVRNDPNRNGGGLVGALGVRRPWRGRGYGRALLLHTFGEFYRRGVTRVWLGVDSENPTGATKLYESVGMTVELEHVVFEKALV